MRMRSASAIPRHHRMAHRGRSHREAKVSNPKIWGAIRSAQKTDPSVGTRTQSATPKVNTPTAREKAEGRKGIRCRREVMALPVYLGSMFSAPDTLGRCSVCPIAAVGSAEVCPAYLGYRAATNQTVCPRPASSVPEIRAPRRPRAEGRPWAQRT